MDNITMVTWKCVSIISGIYFIVFAFIINTKGFVSTFLFKIIPFLFGFISLLVGLKLINFI